VHADVHVPPHHAVPTQRRRGEGHETQGGSDAWLWLMDTLCAVVGMSAAVPLTQRDLHRGGRVPAPRHCTALMGGRRATAAAVREGAGPRGPLRSSRVARSLTIPPSPHTAGRIARAACEDLAGSSCARRWCRSCASGTSCCSCWGWSSASWRCACVPPRRPLLYVPASLLLCSHCALQPRRWWCAHEAGTAQPPTRRPCTLQGDGSAAMVVPNPWGRGHDNPAVATGTYACEGAVWCSAAPVGAFS
jgi:hypothetical protein